MTTKARLPKDPWAPLSGAVQFLLMGLVGLPLAALCLELVLSGHPSLGLLGLAGSDSGCVNLPDLSNVDTGSVQMHAAFGSTLSVHTVTACAHNPSGSQRFESVLTLLPSRLLFISAVVLAWWLLRGETKRGVFSEKTAGPLRFLGWFLVAGSLLSSTIQAFAAFALAESMADTAGFGGWLEFWRPSGSSLILGIAILAFARVMRVGTAMREDVEATI